LSRIDIEHLNCAQIPVRNINSAIGDLYIPWAGVTFADRGNKATCVCARDRLKTPDDLGRVHLANVYFVPGNRHAPGTHRASEDAKVNSRRPIEELYRILLPVSDQQVPVSADDRAKRIPDLRGRVSDERTGYPVVLLHGVIDLAGHQQT
jgi:hypothetical protein